MVIAKPNPKSISKSNSKSNSKSHSHSKSASKQMRVAKANPLASALAPIGRPETSARKSAEAGAVRWQVPLPPLGVKLQPEGKWTTTSGKFDCVCPVVHCAEHGRVLVARQDGATWLPYAQMAPNRSWKYAARFALCLCLTAADTAKFNAIKRNPPYDDMRCMQIVRLQLPQSQKFITRMVYYIRLQSNAPHYQCCQPIATHLQWMAVDDLLQTMPTDLWGPELVDFVQRIAARDFGQRIVEFSLEEEAYLFVPRNPPRNLGEQLLKSVRITGNDVERLYADFLEHCFPSLYQTEHSFRHYLAKYDFERDPTRLSRLFHAFNCADTGYLSFHELLLGLACLEPGSDHTAYRVAFLFRYYDLDCSGGLSVDELRALVNDLGGPPSQRPARLREMLDSVAVTWVNSKQEVNEAEFAAAVADNRIAGTGALCRSAKSLFAQISKSIALRSVHLFRTSEKTALANIVPKRGSVEEVCPTCKDRQYQVATHRVTIDIVSRHTTQRLNAADSSNAVANAPANTALQPQQQWPVITVQQYSLECVFSPTSVANVTIALMRQFVRQKGTVAQPKGLLWDRRIDLWSLVKHVYVAIEPLLERETKCQPVCSPCYVIGDIHGNIEDLFTMERTLWRQTPCQAANLLFLGDYVDRGMWGFECALYLMALKLLNPNKVTLLRGNHEVRSLQRHYSYYRECLCKYDESIGLRVWHLTNSIFDRLPVSATVDSAIFCAHGGIGRSAPFVTTIRQRVPRVLFDPQRQSQIAWEILWSDPCPLQRFLDYCDQRRLDPDAQGGFVFNVRRGTAFMFSETGAINFLRANQLSHIIRAHEVAPPGYVFHFGSICVTIFSSSHYCGNDNDCGLILCHNQRLRLITLDTVNNASATD